MNSYIVRQPIVDRDQRVFAYKLLSRGGTDKLLYRFDGASNPHDDAAQRHHLEGLQEISDGRKCFINFNRRLLLDQAYRVFSSESTVIEVSETERLDVEFVNACRTVRRTGYSLALVDFVVEPQLQPLLKHISLLNVDFPALTEDQHENIVQAANRHGFVAVAEQVNSQEDFARARQLGYTYFQGYYYCQPQKSTIGQLPASQLQCLRLLKAISQPDFRLEEIEELIRHDLSLAVRLLHYLNSPSFGLRNKVNSIRQAVGILGHRPLQKWISMIAVSELSKEKPLVLMNTSLVRAKFCEALGERGFSTDVAGDCFLVGMLSLLDAILDQPMSHILSDLALSSTVIAPLLRQPSPLNALLDLTKALDEGDWRLISALAFQLQIDEDFVFREYEKAILWAYGVTEETR